MALFERAYLVRLLQSQANIIETIQQAIFTESVDFKRISDAAIAGAYDLFFQIDNQVIARESLDFIEQVIDLRLSQRDR